MSDIDRRRIAADAKMTELGYIWREGKWESSFPITELKGGSVILSDAHGAIKQCACVDGPNKVRKYPHMCVTCGGSCL